ncbi:hypothetical protein [Trueperella sp. LYQ143]|uniref:hypothetical protein n=1 Tax=Trueperella sp. LYQ143 TaxID=3391059 RepID=UPI0039834CE1
MPSDIVPFTAQDFLKVISELVAAAGGLYALWGLINLILSWNDNNGGQTRTHGFQFLGGLAVMSLAGYFLAFKIGG